MTLRSGPTKAAFIVDMVRGGELRWWWVLMVKGSDGIPVR